MSPEADQHSAGQHTAHHQEAYERGVEASQAERWSTATLDADELAERTRCVVAAAVSAARELGLAASSGQVLHDAFSVIVELVPLPVVVRVPVALPADLDVEALGARQRRELAVVGWLQRRGVPVVQPTPLVPVEPLQRGGFSMTFWERVEVDPSAKPDYVNDARYAAELHAALRDCPLDLPFLAPLVHGVPACLAFLERNRGWIAGADLERARAEWKELEPIFSSEQAFVHAFPGVRPQVIHGDAPAYNLIRTPSGPLFADFEDATRGPVEWDLAGFGPDAAAAYDAAAGPLDLPPLNREALRVLDAARALQGVVSLALTPQLPALPEMLRPWIERWRSSAFAVGIS